MDLSDEASSTEMIFSATFDIEEDIVDELERFIFLGRLGLVEEAITLADNVLWPHVKHFTIFAEIAAFAVESRAWSLLSRLVEQFDKGGGNCDTEDDFKLLRALRLLKYFAEHKFAFKYSYQKLAWSEVFSALNPRRGQSPSKRQEQEVIILLAVLTGSLSNFDITSHLQPHISRLITASEFSDAARVFSTLCLGMWTHHDTWDIHAIKLLYLTFKTALSETHLNLDSNNEAPINVEISLCQLNLDTMMVALLRILYRKHRATPDDEALWREIHQSLSKLHKQLFDLLPSDQRKPRGIYVEFWRRANPPERLASSLEWWEPLVVYSGEIQGILHRVIGCRRFDAEQQLESIDVYLFLPPRACKKIFKFLESDYLRYDIDRLRLFLGRAMLNGNTRMIKGLVEKLVIVVQNRSAPKSIASLLLQSSRTWPMPNSVLFGDSSNDEIYHISEFLSRIADNFARIQAAKLDATHPDALELPDIDRSVVKVPLDTELGSLDGDVDWILSFLRNIRMQLRPKPEDLLEDIEMIAEYYCKADSEQSISLQNFAHLEIVLREYARAIQRL